MKALAAIASSCLLALVSLQPLPTHAEVLKLDGDIEVLKPVDAPTRGMTKASVEKRYGKPLKKHPAVGKPPISSWEYPGYTVYFEGKYVIHTVANGKH